MEVFESDEEVKIDIRVVKPRRLVESQISKTIDDGCEQMAVVVVHHGVAEHYFSVASEQSLRNSLKGFEKERSEMSEEDKRYVSRGLRRACRRFNVSKPNFLDC